MQYILDNLQYCDKIYAKYKNTLKNNPNLIHDKNYDIDINPNKKISYDDEDYFSSTEETQLTEPNLHTGKEGSQLR